MKAGRNTPASVLAYIDAIWLSNEVDPLELAAELGYTLKQIGRLRDKHGENLILYLQRVKRDRTDQDRFMARQQGRAHPQQYVSSAQGAIDDAACVDDMTQHRLTRDARKRERSESEALILAALDVQAAVRDRLGSPEFRRLAGLSYHRLNKEIEHLIVKTKKRAA